MNSDNLAQIWVYLSASPLFGLTMTLIAYGIAHRVYRLAKGNPLLNPVVTAVGLLIVLLLTIGMPYQDYFAGAQFVHFLLGPATVALAIPLYRQFSKLKKLWLPVLVALLAGVTIGGASVVKIAQWLGADQQTLLSLAPKSVTAPVAMGISERLGGLPSLTAVLVVTTGVIGSVLGTRLFDLLRIRDDSVRGIAMGVAAHGIGTARAFQVSAEMGAFAGLAMALSAFLASVLLPWVMGWLL
ncbi:MAG: LrgB family protein [Gammaproteobacteria bacterium]|nr:LrgB family protein [Gammaproteobacteria bacterium]MBU1722973.1 LrgB family protein [Gammaproteobacteria bacterium]MBU2007106.1 LrgB family protein [Gammaproteobacteria bacterium]